MQEPKNDKEVYFHEWCKKCKYGPLQEHDDPCEECITHPSNENSHRPVNFKEAENA
jgi:hypothetical protein